MRSAETMGERKKGVGDEKVKRHEQLCFVSQPHVAGKGKIVDGRNHIITKKNTYTQGTCQEN